MTSLAQSIIEAARHVAQHGGRCDQVFMNSRDYAELQDTFEYCEAVDHIERLGGTYQLRTTRLGQLAAAMRMTARRGRRFHALQWVAK